MTKPQIIDVRLTNRSAHIIERLDDDIRQKLRDQWSFAPKGVWMMPKFRPTRIAMGQRKATTEQIDRLRKDPTPKNLARIEFLTAALAELNKKIDGMWDGKISLIERWSALPSGLFRATRRDVEEACGIKFRVKLDRQTVKMRKGLPAAGEQYRHQNECTEAMINAVPRGGGIVLAATSAGKTAIAARLFSKVACPCLFVVDQIDLLYQQRDELAEWLKPEDIGVIGDSEFRPARVTVATIQTLSLHTNDSRFARWFDSVDIMVVDELHEQMAKRNFEVLKRTKPVATFGLTATLQTTQKEVRLKAFAFAGPVIFRFPIEEGMDRGVLAQGSALQLLFPAQGNEDDAADYHEEMATEVVSNELKISACRHLCDVLIDDLHRHVVVLVERVAHLHEVSDVMKHIPHRLAYGKVDIEDRQQAKLAFEEEEINLLIANKVFKKGVSIKRIDAMIDMAEGKSKNDAVQKFGRGLRLHADKSEFVYVDIGTAGHGRFAKAATSRRRALQKAGIQVTAVHVRTERQAVAELRKFMEKVTACRNPKT